MMWRTQLHLFRPLRNIQDKTPSERTPQLERRKTSNPSGMSIWIWITAGQKAWNPLKTLAPSRNQISQEARLIS